VTALDEALALITGFNLHLSSMSLPTPPDEFFFPKVNTALFRDGVYSAGLLDSYWYKKTNINRILTIYLISWHSS
jgi:hypothetical protein